MRKLLLILIALPMIGFGQNFKLDEIGLVFGPSHKISKHPLINLVPLERDGLIENLSHSEGLSLRYNITPSFSFNTQFLYKVNQSRFIHTITFSDPLGTTIDQYKSYHISKQKYLNVPLLVEFNYIVNKFNIAFKLGNYIEYLIASSEKEEGSFLASVLDEEMNYYKKWDFGFMIGSGISYEFNIINISFDILANAGTINTSLLKIDNGDTKHYNKSITGLIGISYKLKQ